MQVFLPALQNARFAVQRCSQRLGRNFFEPDIAALQMFAWPDEPVFADIGVNRGLTTDAMRLLVPDARIIGFEPNPLLFEQLTSLYADAPGVDLHAIALGRRSLDGILYVPVYRNWLFDGLGSLKRNEAAEWLSADTLYFFDQRHLRLREYPCRVRRLDELDLAPSFIKIDVQGHEYEVLCGAEQTLRRHQPLLMIESPDENREVALLRDLGYRVGTFDRGHFHLDQIGRLNCFFLAAQHLEQLGRAAELVDFSSLAAARLPAEPIAARAAAPVPIRRVG